MNKPARRGPSLRNRAAIAHALETKKMLRQIHRGDNWSAIEATNANVKGYADLYTSLSPR